MRTDSKMEAPASPKRFAFLRRKRWLIVFGAVVLLVSAWGMLRKPRDFYYSGRRISVSVQPSARFSDKGIVVHTFWDGPTGEFSHGDIFGLRFGKWMAVVDVAYEPIDAIKRDLPKTVPGLIGKLASKDSMVKQCATRALVEMGPAAESAMPEFLKRYGNGDGSMEEPIVELAETAGGPVVPHLIAGLNDSRAKVRQKSAEALGDIGVEAMGAVGKLTTLLRDQDVNVVITSALALRKIEKRDHGEVSVLVSLLKHADSQVRDAAVLALGEFGEDAAEAVPALISLLDEKSGVSGWAARTLGLIGKPAREAVPKLIELMDSRNQQTVGFAAEALGRIGTDAQVAIPKLVKLVENRQHAVAALLALSSMGEAAVPSLIDLYKNGRGSRFFIAKELMKQGARAAAAVPCLRKDLASGKPGVVVVAAMTLGSIGEPAKPALEELLTVLKNSQDSHVRLRVAEAVWRLDRNTNVVAPVMIDELANWSRQSNALSHRTVDSYGQSRQQVAVEVLSEIGPAAREAIPYLKLMSRSSIEEERAVATRALKAIGSERYAGAVIN